MDQIKIFLSGHMEQLCRHHASVKASAWWMHKWIKSTALHPVHALSRLLQVLYYWRCFSLYGLIIALILCLLADMDCCYVMLIKRPTHDIMSLPLQDPDVLTGKHTEYRATSLQCFCHLIYNLSRPPHSLLPIFERCLTTFGGPILLPHCPQQCYSYHIPLPPRAAQYSILLSMMHDSFFLKKKKKALRNLTWTSKSCPAPRVNPAHTKGRWDRGQRQKNLTNIFATVAHCSDFPNRLNSASGDHTQWLHCQAELVEDSWGEEKWGCRHEGKYQTKYLTKAPKGWEWEAGVAQSLCKIRPPPRSWKQLMGHIHQEEHGLGREVRNNPCSCVESCWLSWLQQI